MPSVGTRFENNKQAQRKTGDDIFWWGDGELRPDESPTTLQ